MTVAVVAVLCGAQSWTWSVFIFWVRSPNTETRCPVTCQYSSFGLRFYAASGSSRTSLMSTQVAYVYFEGNAVILLPKLH